MKHEDPFKFPIWSALASGVVGIFIGIAIGLALLCMYFWVVA